VDLLAFVNGGWDGLGVDRSPGDYTLGEVMLELFHKNVGTDRRTKGDRAVGIVSDLVRYLLPFAVETAAWCDHGERGIAQLRVPTGGRTAADPRR
jgi:hypothetical protein